MSTLNKQSRRYRKVRIEKTPRSPKEKFATSSHVNSSKTGKKKFFILLFLVLAGGYYFYLESFQIKKTSDLDQKPTESVNDTVKKRAMDLKMKQALQVQDVLQERYNEPVKDVDMTGSPDTPAVELGVEFFNNPDMKDIVKEFEKDPFKSDMYEDPSNEIRRQIAHGDWLEEHLREKDEQERSEFLENFVKKVEEQGYTVEITEDMQAIIHPVEEEKKDEEEFEEIKINLK